MKISFSKLNTVNKIVSFEFDQIHPHGWCALSRNISYDESTEFTCLHDIQHRDYDESADIEMDGDSSATTPKPLDSNEMQQDELPVVNSSTSTVQTSNNDTQALNLTTSTSASPNVSLDECISSQSFKY